MVRGGQSNPSLVARIKHSDFYRPERFVVGRSRLLVLLAFLAFLYPNTGWTAKAISPLSQFYSFDFKSQPLSESLIELGAQTSLTIIVSGQHTKSLIAPAVNGRMKLTAVLEQLLADTSLGYRFVDNHTLSISPAHKLAASSFQQSKAEESAPLPEQSRYIEEILVTSQWRRQNLQEIPKAVSVLGADVITDAAINNLADVATRVPGLTVSYFSLGQPTIHMRGIGSNDDGAALDNSVIVYLDGIYVGRITAIDLQMLDVERIEVMRGPQGTLYGRNSIGGTINVIRKRPDPEGRAEASISLGNFNH